MQKRLITGLGLHSGAIIAFQLALMQLISIVQWHHFAYMIISVAMLGFGASGTLLALARTKLLGWSSWLVPALMMVSGLLMMVVFHLARMEAFRFDVYLLFVNFSQFPALAANYLIFFLPFFTGALAIGIVFIKYAKSIGRLYFSNMLGSGVGGLLILVLSGFLHPLHAPPLIGLVSVGGGWLCMGQRYRRANLVFGILALATAVSLFLVPANLKMSEYKGLAQALNLPGAEIIHSQPDIHGYIEVLQSPALRYAPAVSLSYTGSIPVKKQVFVNGDYFGAISKYKPDTAFHILEHTTMALPYAMDERERVLVIKPGTGTAVAHALTAGVRQVEAVLENGGVLELMKTRFAGESGRLFLDPRVETRNMQVRNFLASESAGQYDLIVLPLLDAFGGTAGLNALREDYALTLESFSLMWQRLSPNGAITVSSWVDYPSRTPLKILSTLVQTARDNGIESPRDHIAAIRSWGTISFVLQKTPLNFEEIARIRSFGHQKFFDPALLPGITQEERVHYNRLEEDSFMGYLDRVMDGNPGFFEDYGFMIDPATDDKPYFSQFLRLKFLSRLSDIFGKASLPFLELGFLIVVVTFLQSLLLAILLIILPLFRLRRNPQGKTVTLLYFAALGLGYMFAEILLIQRFVLFLGHPVYALSAVISTMLIASGAGSLLSDRMKAIPASPRLLALLVSGLLLILALFLTPFLQNFISGPLLFKIAVSLLIIGIPSFLMGMLFPLGIRILHARDQTQIPWAWGINGCISVISTSLATLIAVESGFRVVMLVAAASYLLVFICSFFFSNQPASKRP